MGYQYEIPADRLGKLKILWVMREYGLYGVWVIRESTVVHWVSMQSHDISVAVMTCYPFFDRRESGCLSRSSGLSGLMGHRTSSRLAREYYAV
ncbi:hypothetical protein BS17DRAFT_773357 [Gyrodon lividus]|nr:hypothetical protein BS17DRAFT_773357 [Gyrodon lividus]